MIKFGTIRPVVADSFKRHKDAKVLRDKVKPDGVDGNATTRYEHDVSFSNLKVKVNVTKVAVDGCYGEGVAKGALFSGVPITVPTNTSASTMHAMKKRCDFSPNKENTDQFVKGHKLLMDKFEPMPVIRVGFTEYERYLSSQPAKKVEDVLRCFEGGEMHFAGETKGVFAKNEALLKDHGSQPRVVYQAKNSRDPSRDQMHNATTGAVIMILQERMQEVFSLSNPKNVGNKVIYAPGRSGSEIAEIVYGATGQPIESDMKSNDATYSGAWRKYEAMFYKKLGAPDWFVREFARCTDVKVWTRYGVAAKMEGQRWSGESTTTTGNSYVGMAQILAALADAGVAESTNIHGGDDYAGIVDAEPAAVVQAIVESVAKTGMTAEAVAPPTREHMTFYRKRHVRSEAGCHPIPQFGRVVAKLNVRANRNANVSDADMMAGKYASAAFNHKHVPELGEMLLDAAVAMSPRPHFDGKEAKLIGFNAAEGMTALREKIVSAPKHSRDTMQSFVQNVYGSHVDYKDILDIYAYAAQSCIEYVKDWTVVDKKGTRVNRTGNIRYVAPMMEGVVVDTLIAKDT